MRHCHRHLSNIRKVRLDTVRRGIRDGCTCFPIIFSNCGCAHGRICTVLRRRKVATEGCFCPLAGDFRYCQGYSVTKATGAPITRRLSLHILALPLCTSLSLRGISHVYSVVLK